MTLVVNLFGGPGSGKSTIAAGIFSLLKLHGINAELVTEFPKGAVWEKRFKVLENQLYILAKEYHSIWRVYQNPEVDVVITDGPIILSLVYGQGSETFNKLVLETYRKFKNKNYLISRTKKYNPSGRNQTEEQADDIARVTKIVLDGYGIPYESYNGNWLTINKITNETLNELGIQQQIGLHDVEERDLNDG